MKASLKFREEQKPLLRAKVPLSILGLPFQSGIVAGETKELSLNLSTFFDSGPSFKVAYRPNDTWNPFSLIVKTGTGPFGSPVASSMLMSAEFNLLGKGNPSFMLHFKPRFGDFSIKKTHSSSSVFDGNLVKSMRGVVLPEEDSSIEVVDAPAVNGFKKISVLPSATAGDIAGFLSGVEVAARTALPVRGRAVLTCRWGVRVPAETRHDLDATAGMSLRRFPFLVMNKIGIEHLDGSNSKASKATNQPGKISNSDPNSGLAESADVTAVCLAVKHQLEALKEENGMLKRAVEDLRQEISNIRPFAQSSMDFSSSKYAEPERNGGKSRVDRRNNGKTTTDVNGKKTTMEGDITEELKKALKGAP